MPHAQHTPKTALVGVDYSDLCIPALDEALRLLVLSPASGSDKGAVLIPLLVLPDQPPPGGNDVDTQLRIARAKLSLVRLVHARVSHLGHPSPHILPCVRFGDPAANILEEARARSTDLIAVGTHGRRGLSHLLLGSVAEEVMRRAPCSVLVARRVAPPTVLDLAEHLPLDLGPVEGTGDEVDQVTDAEPQSAAVLSDPYIEAGQVALHVLDVATGQTFVCWFADPVTVRVEPLEREWVPPPSPTARSRATWAALNEARRDPQSFKALFARLDRSA
jgi:nucleotide-binding universal stress UspA family protein